MTDPTVSWTPPSSPPLPPPPPGLPSVEHGLPLWGVLELVALVALLIGLFVPEQHTKLWDDTQAWSIFAIVCAIAQVAPFLRRATRLDAAQAWTVAAVGAAGLALYWLLIVLPVIGRNTSFSVTLAAAAAGGAVWLAPGRYR